MAHCAQSSMNWRQAYLRLDKPASKPARPAPVRQQVTLPPDSALCVVGNAILLHHVLPFTFNRPRHCVRCGAKLSEPTKP